MRTLEEKRIVPIPDGCKVTLSNKTFTFDGPLGTQKYDASSVRFTFLLKDSSVEIVSWHGNKKKNALLGTIASHIRNHMEGVVKGFKFFLRAAYRHFSINMTIADAGKSVVVKNFLGAKTSYTFPVRGSAKASMGEHKDILVIEGTNLEDVAQTAAHISNSCAKKKDHDCRIFLDGIYVMEKKAIRDE